MSVYKIVDKTSGQLIYIGQTKELSQRIEWHHSDYYTKKYSNLYTYIRNNGGWDNTEFIELAAEQKRRKRLLLENGFQLDLQPMFYWICNNSVPPRKIGEVLTGKPGIKSKNTINIPGKTLEMPEVG